MTLTTHDFGDGFGAVPAHRHCNGGGWVADTAHIADTAYVGLGARVFGEAYVFGEARVFGAARVYGGARVYGESRVYGEAHVFGKVRVFYKARVSGMARASRSPIVIAGGEYDVTITDTHVQIGCMCHPLSWWRENPPPESCPKLEAMRDAIVAIAEAHQCL